MKNLLLFLIALIVFSVNDLFAQTCQDASIELSAVVQSAPPKVTLHWRANAAATQYTLYRKIKSATVWGTLVATLGASDTMYIDSSVSVGVSYEYKLQRTGSGFTGYGYINSGIEIPAIENRGIMILLVDSTFIDSLAMEIGRLEYDLTGDGWTVIRHDVSRTAAASDIKSIILADYNSDPANTKALFLLGHVPVPYSGNIYPDGHTDHQGAWPADVYYADMNGTWTDASINSTVASDPRQHNIPGDGKFDQGSLPSDVELQVGRVDLSNMPAFAKNEQELLRDYLDKDHEYRNKVFSVVHRAVVDDNFGYFSGEAFGASGWKNAGPLVGFSNVAANDYFASMTGNSYLWSYGCGGGSYTSCSGVGTTPDFAVADLQGVFTMLFGSYFGDWDSQNNFLRAPLCQGTTLTDVWSGRPHWQFHHMALGENIGYDVRISQNNTSMYFASYGARFTHLALMGDPSLRNDILAPASNVTATRIGTNAQVSWTASTDPVLGYNIYVKNDSIDNFIRVNSYPITGTTYTDSCLLDQGVYTYMVRALCLQVSPSGTYYNLSQGISDTLFNPNDLEVHASATYSIVDSDVSFTNTSINATLYHWDFGDGTFSNLEDPTHTFADGNYTVMLIAGNACDQDTVTYTIGIGAAISEISGDDHITIYPNPSSGKITISLTDPGVSEKQISVFDLTGHLITEQRMTTEKAELDLSSLTNGIYILQISDAREKHHVKLVIQK
jgi:hypothetical protein